MKMDNQSDWDARTLAEAEVIKVDSSRLAAAKIAAIKLAGMKKEEADALKKVAGQRVSKSNTNVYVPEGSL
jgi:hypothetical protein